MNDSVCTYIGKRDELLVSYLYDDIGTEERAAFDRHLSICALCRSELDALRGVRTEMAHWTPPEFDGHVNLELAPPFGKRKPLVAALREIPAWAQFAAAILVIGVAAGLANLNVQYSAADGLSVRTGWRQASPAENITTPSNNAAAQPTSSTAAPWHDDLSALERDLRSAMATRSEPSSVSGDEAILRRVRQLIQDSERRQQNELALRVAEVARDMQTQRQADLVKIDRTLGIMQSRTGMEVMRTQRQVNSLAQQVSQRP